MVVSFVEGTPFCGFKGKQGKTTVLGVPKKETPTYSFPQV